MSIHGFHHMKIFTLLFFIILLSCSDEKNNESVKKIEYGLVLHGGAGSIYKGRYTVEEENEYKNKLTEALLTGYKILIENGTSLDAVETVILVLENSPLFNAGIGAVMTNAETVEMDASIMDGSTLNAGAVAGVKHVKNPISLARAVMEKSKHVLMVGDGAESFAQEIGMGLVDNNYFFTERRIKEIQKIKAEERKSKTVSDRMHLNQETKFGTVGCAALDKHGNLAAGTSTGGMANKRWGRVGDSPIIGAGTYANNKTCALSATGHGEFFMRNVVTHNISALMEYKNLSLQEAANEIVMKTLVEQNGSGGVIGIDNKGNITMIFNSEGMFRGYITDEGKPTVAIYEE